MKLAQVHNLEEVILDGNYPKPAVQPNAWVGDVKPIGQWSRQCVNSFSFNSSGSVAYDVDQRLLDTASGQWGNWTRLGTYGVAMDGLWCGLPGFSNTWGAWLPPYASSSEIEGTHRACIAKAYTEGFDALTFLAELRPTLKMLAGLTGRLINLVKGLRNASKSREEFANAWLEARYGWLPLVMDIQEIVNVLNGRYSQLFRVRATGNYGRLPSDKPLGSTVMSHWLLGHIPFSKYPPVWRSEIRYQGGSGSVLCGAGVEAALNGVVVNLPLTVVETLPYTFVLDWVINLSESVALLAPTADRTIKFAYSCSRWASLFEIHNFPDSKAETTYTTWPVWYVEQRTTLRNTYAQKATWQVTSFQRLPQPTTADVDLTASINLNWKRMVDGILLINQRRLEISRILSFRR